MFKKLLVLIAVLSLLSCKHAANKAEEKESEFKVEDQAIDIQNNYQTIENEQQAAALDQAQQAQIEEQAQQTQVQEIEVQDRVLFAYDSAELSAEAKKILDTQVAWLKSDEAIKITIEGHCDERGTREYNIALGEKRANSAREYLVSHGINNSRIKIISYGKERPAFFGTSEEVMAKNRRAVTVVN